MEFSEKREFSEKHFNLDKFIGIMRVHPELWNMRSKEFGKRSDKEKIWIVVCREMYEGFDGFALKTKYMIGRNLRKKWKNLRTCYARELRSSKNEGETSRRHRPYIYFDDLSFLKSMSSSALDDDAPSEDDLAKTGETSETEEQHCNKKMFDTHCTSGGLSVDEESLLGNWEKEFDVDKFIRVVRERPVIWNMAHGQYGNKVKREDIWLEVCKEMCAEFDKMDNWKRYEIGYKLKKKWLNLRNCYSRENRKKTASESTKHRKKYIHFDDLSFLQANRSMSNFDDIEVLSMGSYPEEHPTIIGMEEQPRNVELEEYRQRNEKTEEHQRNIEIEESTGSLRMEEYPTSIKIEEHQTNVEIEESTASSLGMEEFQASIKMEEHPKCIEMEEHPKCIEMEEHPKCIEMAEHHTSTEIEHQTSIEIEESTASSLGMEEFQASIKMEEHPKCIEMEEHPKCIELAEHHTSTEIEHQTSIEIKEKSRYIRMKGISKHIEMEQSTISLGMEESHIITEIEPQLSIEMEEHQTSTDMEEHQTSSEVEEHQTGIEIEERQTHLEKSDSVKCKRISDVNELSFVENARSDQDSVCEQELSKDKHIRDHIAPIWRRVFDMDKFISEIRKCPELWNTNSEEYADRRKKEYAWLKVGRKLYRGFDDLSDDIRQGIGDIMRKKWKNLRTCFGRELRKRKKSPRKSQKYIHFDDLSFLQSCSTSHIGNGDVLSEGLQAEELQESEERSNEDDVEDSSHFRIKTSSFKEQIPEVPSAFESDLSNDEDRLFLLSLVKDLKDVPSKQKLQSKCEIMSVISRLQDISSPVETNYHASSYTNPYNPNRLYPYLTGSSHQITHEMELMQQRSPSGLSYNPPFTSTIPRMKNGGDSIDESALASSSTRDHGQAVVKSSTATGDSVADPSDDATGQFTFKMEDAGDLIDKSTSTSSSTRNYDQTVIKLPKTSTVTGGSVVNPTRNAATHKFNIRNQNGADSIDGYTLPSSSKRDHDQSVVKSSATSSSATGGKVVDPSKDATTLKFTFNERRVVNIGYFVKSLQKLNFHSRENCNLCDMVITAETRNGWNVGIILRCELCHIETIVWLEDPNLKVVPIAAVACSQLVPTLQKSTADVSKEKETNTAEVQQKSTRGPAATVESKTELPKLPSQYVVKERSAEANSSSLYFVDTNIESPSPTSAIPVIKQVETVNGSAPISAIPVIKQVETVNESPPATISAIPVIKQEPISPCKDMTPLSKNAQSSPSGPTLVQLTFCVDNLDSSSKVDENLGGISFKPSSKGIRVSLADQSESITVTPDTCKDALKATAISVAGLSEGVSIAADVNAHESVVLPVDLNLVKKEVTDYGTSDHVSSSSNLVSDNVCELAIASITGEPKTSSVSTESLVRTLTVSADGCPRNSTVLTEIYPRNSFENLPSSTTLTEHLPGHSDTPIKYHSISSSIPVKDLSRHPSVSSEKQTTAQFVLEHPIATSETKARVDESSPEKNQCSSKRGAVDEPASNNSKKLATDHRNTNS